MMSLTPQKSELLQIMGLYTVYNTIQIKLQSVVTCSQIQTQYSELEAKLDISELENACVQELSPYRFHAPSKSQPLQQYLFLCLREEMYILKTY